MLHCAMHLSKLWKDNQLSGLDTDTEAQPVLIATDDLYALFNHVVEDALLGESLI